MLGRSLSVGGIVYEALVSVEMRQELEDKGVPFPRKKMPPELYSSLQIETHRSCEPYSETRVVVGKKIIPERM